MKASFHIHDPHSERVFGRCAPYDPPRSSNKQKEQAPFACSPHFERVTRIELASTAWEAVVLPMNYTRVGI